MGRPTYFDTYRVADDESEENEHDEAQFSFFVMV